MCLILPTGRGCDGKYAVVIVCLILPTGRGCDDGGITAQSQWLGWFADTVSSWLA